MRSICLHNTREVHTADCAVRSSVGVDIKRFRSAVDLGYRVNIGSPDRLIV